VTGVRGEHGEGPVWTGWPRLRWADMLAGGLLTVGPASG
jgi:hypothetical protein